MHADMFGKNGGVGIEVWEVEETPPQTGPLAIGVVIVADAGGICSRVVLEDVALKISAIKLFFFLNMLARGLSSDPSRWAGIFEEGRGFEVILSQLKDGVADPAGGGGGENLETRGRADGVLEGFHAVNEVREKADGVLEGFHAGNEVREKADPTRLARVPG